MNTPLAQLTAPSSESICAQDRSAAGTVLVEIAMP
jgi:hypothetical protein